MDEHAKDVERVSDVDITPELSRFMGTIAGTTVFELGELSAAEIRFWRFKRSIRHAQKAKAILEDAGISPQAVPFRTLVPLIESASLEEDDDLTDRWAALLANAAGGTVGVPPSFPSVLRELEPVEAVMLDYVYDGVMIASPELRRTVAVSRQMLMHAFEMTEEQVIYHTDNLLRLRLVGPGSDHVGEESRRVTLSEFGRAFVRACRPPSQPDPPVRYTNAAELAKQVRRNQEAMAVMSEVPQSDPTEPA